MSVVNCLKVGGGAWTVGEVSKVEWCGRLFDGLVVAVGMWNTGTWVRKVTPCYPFRK